MQVTIDFQSVEDGLPPRESQDPDYSVQCLAIVNGEIFDRSVAYKFDEKGWVWADLALGNFPEDYEDELGGDTPTVTHWAPWPMLVPSEVAA